MTVLACDGASADAAATVIANAVDIDVPGIVRRPACSIRDDSDLGERLVVTGVPPLALDDADRALAAGAAVARAEVAAGRIIAAVLTLQQRVVIVDGRQPRRLITPRMPNRLPLFATPLIAAPC